MEQGFSAIAASTQAPGSPSPHPGHRPIMVKNVGVLFPKSRPGVQLFLLVSPRTRHLVSDPREVELSVQEEHKGHFHNHAHRFATNARRAPPTLCESSQRLHSESVSVGEQHLR